MDREILFKGFHPCENGFEKVFVNGEWIKGLWVEGAYIPHYYSSRYGKISAIFVNDDVEGKTYRYPVIPETVGQYIGNSDKNDKKIFEGDMLLGAWKTKLVIYYDECYLAFRARETSGTEHDISYYDNNMLEVVGNIHDNGSLEAE